MKLVYNGPDIGPIPLTDLSSSITAGPSGIAFTNIVSQNQTISFGQVIDLQDSDEAVKSYLSGQLASLITGGTLDVQIEPLTGMEFTPDVPANWSPVPTTIKEALNSVAATSFSYQNGTAPTLKILDGAQFGDSTHYISTAFINSIDAAITFDIKLGGVSKLNVGATQTYIDQNLQVTGSVTIGTLTGLLSATAGLVSTATPSEVITALGYTPLNKAGDTMTGSLTLAADPTIGLHAATKQYVDSKISKQDYKESVRVATLGNISLSSLPVIDGVTIIAGDRVLVKDQTLPEQNGIYIASAGIWSRATDADDNEEVTGSLIVMVSEGTTQSDTGWIVTTDDPIVIGTTPIDFVQVTGTSTFIAGNGLVRTLNTYDVVSTGAGSLTVTADSINLTSGIVSPGTYTKLTVDTFGRVTTGASLLSADITTALGYTPVDKAGDTMTGTLNLPSSGLVVGTNDFLIVGSNTLIGTSTNDGLNKLQVAGDVKITGSIESTVKAKFGSVVLGYTFINVDYTVGATDYTIEADCSSSPVEVTLPLAPEVGRVLNICRFGPDGNFLILDGNGNTINGSLILQTAIQYFNWTLQWTGTEWRIL